MNEAERNARLRLFWSENVGPVTFRQLIARYGSAVDALDALPELARRGGRKRPIKICPDSALEKELALVRAFGGQHVIIGDEDYPDALAAIEDAPPVLAVKGNITLLRKRGLAMVGARNASAAGRKIAMDIAAKMGAAGYVINSGMARGIDTAAHQGAINTGTIAVLGTGIDIVYPSENKDLHDLLATQGLLVSEHRMRTKPQARHFPRRNRIISGLSLGVLVVEAAVRSGSLITARLAAEQGREVFAIPGSPMDPRAKGANKLIRDGAQLVESAEDMIEALDQVSRSALREPSLPFDEETGHTISDAETGEDDQTRVLEQLSLTPTEVDDIIRFSGLPASLVKSILLELELAGRTSRHFGNKVALVPADEGDA